MTGDVNDVMPGSNGLGFLVILNKSSELRFGLGRSELIFRTWARPVQCGLRGAHARWLSQWVESWQWTKSQHRKIVSLSPRDENLNLKKVINVSYLNQESRQYFVFFGFLCVWTFYACEPLFRIMVMLQEEDSPRVNRVSIFERRRVLYRVDRSP